VLGDLQALLVALKGLPLAYSKDMQEDKEPVFDAVDTLELGLEAAHGMIETARFDRPAMARAAGVGFTTATDLADWLVRVLGLPFRTAHGVAGRAVKEAEHRGCGLEELPLEVLQGLEPGITPEVFDVLGVERSVASRTSLGGTAPARVREAAAAARARFLEAG
jgi:argininosuccinate lyase